MRAHGEAAMAKTAARRETVPQLRSCSDRTVACEQTSRLCACGNLYREQHITDAKKA